MESYNLRTETNITNCYLQESASNESVDCIYPWAGKANYFSNLYYFTSEPKSPYNKGKRFGNQMSGLRAPPGKA